MVDYEICEIFGYPRGSLPTRYLRVPLISSKLRKVDCAALTEQIAKRISSLTNNFLSFAGRLQLAKSVLFSIQSFWSAHFILPSSITKGVLFEISFG